MHRPSDVPVSHGRPSLAQIPGYNDCLVRCEPRACSVYAVQKPSIHDVGLVGNLGQGNDHVRVRRGTQLMLFIQTLVAEEANGTCIQ